MFISQTAEYAIRAMASIATLPAAEKVRATDLGRFTGIPAPYLSKILRRLVLAGFVNSVRHGRRILGSFGSCEIGPALLAVVGSLRVHEPALRAVQGHRPLPRSAPGRQGSG